MKPFSVLFILSFLFLFSNLNIAQKRELPEKREDTIRLKPTKVNSDKSEQGDRKPKNSENRIRNTPDNSSKPILSNNKLYTERPKRIKPAKSKKKIIKEEYVEAIEPVYVIQETIIYNESPQDIGYCKVLNNYSEGVEITDYSFPDFPLRFRSANIFYEFTDRGEDYYEIIIDVETVYNNFFNTFGVLINYFNGQKQVIVFNEENDFLSLGERFKFHKQIKVQEIGYMNLRLGYFDDELKVFYPEDLYPDKTDKMIFLEKPDLIYINSYK